MYLIDKNIENTIIIKNSKFITNLFVVDSVKDVDKYLELIKNKYKDANHNCYAYIIDNIRKCSDDKEPSGTAGIPIMNIIEKRNINNILVIVTRYFGGIKLGSGGLIRAYSNSTSKALDNVSLVNYTKGYNINIIFNYSDIKHIDYILKNIKIENKVFDDMVKYNLNASDKLLSLLRENKINYEIVKEIYIKKV